MYMAGILLQGFRACGCVRIGDRIVCCTDVPEVATVEAFPCADDLTQNSTSGATQLLDGLITITDPQLFSDGSAKIRNTAVGAAISATGLNYAPCVVVAAPAGSCGARACHCIFL